VTTITNLSPCRIPIEEKERKEELLSFSSRGITLIFDEYKSKILSMKETQQELGELRNSSKTSLTFLRSWGMKMKPHLFSQVASLLSSHTHASKEVSNSALHSQYILDL
jgi:hypothetical protein